MTTNEIEFDDRRIQIQRFRSLALARAARDRAVKPMRIVIGDAPEYWLVIPLDAERLVRAGYEYAPETED
jgi:hypothetical protein